MSRYMITELASIQGYKKVYYMVDAKSEEEAINKVENYDVEAFDEEITVTDSEHINLETELR